MTTKEERLDAAFSALADPARRAVIAALVERPHRAGELAGQVGLSAPALSRHLRVLRRAGLVVDEGIEDDARVRVYRLVPDALAPTRAWIDRMERFWGEQLAAFKAHVEKRAAPRQAKPTSRT